MCKQAGFVNKMFRDFVKISLTRASLHYLWLELLGKNVARVDSSHYRFSAWLESSHWLESRYHCQFVRAKMFLRNFPLFTTHVKVANSGSDKSSLPYPVFFQKITALPYCYWKMGGYQRCADSTFLTLHPILFGKFWIRIQFDSATTMMQVIRLLFDCASI